MDSLETCVKIPLEPEILTDVVEKAKDFCLMHGICMRRKDAFDRDALHFAPFLLMPSPFPRQEFYRAKELQTVLNELMHKVAHDNDFLKETLSKTITVDDFTGKLFEIHQKIIDEGGSAQNTSLGLFRSDYFYCCDSQRIKQVEFNTIASSFGALSARLVLAQKYILGELNRRDLLKNIPHNGALEGLAAGMLDAWTIYNVKTAVILFIIEDVSYNICDQKFHEFEIRKQNPDAFVIRKTLTEVAKDGYLEKGSKKLFVEKQEVAVVYFRCGYHPDQYHTEKEWDARLMIERSLAIKSPSIQYHLAGTKKVQQALALPGILEKYFDDKKKIEQVRGIFTGLSSVDNDEQGNKAVAEAMANPERYVLKPQREGGGNNIYGQDIPPFLSNIADANERNAYILMDRINPPITTNYVVRPGKSEAEMVKVVSELGIFGYVIGDANSIKINKEVGHMLRTKLSHVNEGGVAAGLGALDSVYLVDKESCCQGLCKKGGEGCCH